MKKHFIPFVLLPFWILVYAGLDSIADFAVYELFGMHEGSALTESVRFFVYETPKVFLLLVLIIFAIGIVRTYFSPERTRRMLENKSLFAGNVLASLLGVVTPFCSCSAVPLFIGFVEAGVPLGVTFSFLISAPMVNEVALVLLFGLFGWETALLYASTGLLIAMISGFVIGKLKLDRYIEPWVFEIKSQEISQSDIKISFGERIMSGMTAVKDIVSKVWLFILLGIAVGSGIHGYVPENFMAGIMGESAWWSVPAAVLIGVPMYSNAAGVIPVMHALLEKGASLGTALAFMMSVIGLSLPEAIILKKVLKLPLIMIFFGIVATGIVFIGYIFNLVF